MTGDGGVIRFGPFRLDRVEGRLLWGTETLELRPKAFDLLVYLAARPGRLVTKDELLASLWPGHVTEGVVKTTVHEVRRALGRNGDPRSYLVTEARRGYRFVAPVSMDRGAGTAPTALAGRDAELGDLTRVLARSADGERRMVLVIGEAGIGKSALVEELISRGSRLGFRSAVGRCLEQFGDAEPYLPVFEAFDSLASSDAALAESLVREAPAWAASLPRLVSGDERQAVARAAVSGGPSRLLGSAAEWLEAVASERPLVLVIEDLQWSDAATLSLLAYLARRRGPARLAVVGTVRRPPELPDGHPLRAVEAEIVRHDHCAVTTLTSLSKEASAELVRRRTSGRVAGAVAEKLHERSGGNPLFLRGLADAVSGEDGGQGGPSVDLLPAAVRGVVDRQLDARAPEELGLLQAAAALGGAFEVEDLAAVVGRELTNVEETCEAFVRHGLLVRVLPISADGGTRYRFGHDLFREACYERLVASRRRDLHRRIGRRLESASAERLAERAEQAGIVARHYRRGGETELALSWYGRAVAAAARRFAYRDVADLAGEGLALLERLPRSPERDSRELRFRTHRGLALMATSGYADPEVEASFRRAGELCESAAAEAALGASLLGLWGYWLMRGDHAAAARVAARVETIARRAGRAQLRAEAHLASGVSSFCLGDYARAVEHLRATVSQSDEPAEEHRSSRIRFGRDTGVVGRAFAAWALWHTGRTRQALELADEGLVRARRLDHAQSLAFALLIGAAVRALERDAPAVAELTAELTSLCERHGLDQWQAYGRALRGWSLALTGDPEAGLTMIEEGVAAVREAGGAFNVPMLHGLWAEALRSAGAEEAARERMAQALAFSRSTGEVHSLPEIVRRLEDPS